LSSVRVMAVRQPGVLEHQDGQWVNPPEFAPPARSAASALSPYLHALRRHWLLAAILGLLFAAAGFLAVWYWYGDRYEAVALLRVSPQDKRVVFQMEAPMGPTEFDIYKSTQQQLIKNRFVITSALRRREVQEFNLDEAETDAIGWLSDRLKVTFPGKAEIMQVSLLSTNREEAKALVDAVVEAYMTLIVGDEKKKQNERLDQLDRIYEEKETALRDKRTELKGLAEKIGASDKKGVSLKQQIALEQFGLFQRQHIDTQFRLRHAKGELDAQKALIESIKDMKIAPFEVEKYVREDPMLRQKNEDIYWRTMDAARTQSLARAGVNSPYVRNQQKELETMQAEYDAKIDELKEGVRALKRADYEKERLKWEVQVNSLIDQEEEYDNQVKEKRKEVDKVSQGSIDMDMLMTGIEQYELVLKGVADQREKLKVEVKSEPRVTIIQRAAVPESQALVALRMTLSLLATVLGLCIPVGLIALWDVRRQRINSAAQVSRELGFSVVGSVPVIPARAIRRLGSPSRRHQSWHMRLSESIDGIAARFHRRAALQKTRVILVSSATGGEGKTTLATQLALSFARHGRRTVLVDFDLRRPALEAVFGFPLEPGVSDALRGDEDLSQLIYPTATENLAVLTAGRWDRQALAALANGGAGPMFERLRADFEFVVVDSSPVLPVADTRFVSQHADAVLLSVFRDISQAPRIQAAREILEAFGVRSVEAVVTGPGDSQSARDLGYESRLPT